MLFVLTQEQWLATSTGIHDRPDYQPQLAVMLQAATMLERLLSPVDDELNQHKQNQLIELAKINGASSLQQKPAHCLGRTLSMDLLRPQTYKQLLSIYVQFHTYSTSKGLMHGAPPGLVIALVKLMHTHLMCALMRQQQHVLKTSMRCCVFKLLWT